MSYLIASPARTDLLATQQPVSAGQLVPIEQAKPPAPLTSAVTAALVRAQQCFDAAVELRGEFPTPTRFLPRTFSKPISWGLLTAAAGAALASPVLLYDVALGCLATATAVGLSWVIGGATGDLLLQTSPLHVISRHRRLEPKHLSFLADSGATTPLQQAAMGVLAERWITRLDAQRVRGNAAFSMLENVAAHAKELPEDVRAQAKSVVAVLDVMVEPTGGRLRRELSDSTVGALLITLAQLPSEERRATAAELLKLYFKGDVPRVPVATQRRERELYRALQDALSQSPTSDDAEVVLQGAASAA